MCIRDRALPVDESVLEATGDCDRVQGSFELPAGSSVLEADGAESSPLLLGRFGDEPTVDVGAPPPGGTALINLPADEADVPWSAESATELKVCPLTVPEG